MPGRKASAGFSGRRMAMVVAVVSLVAVGATSCSSGGGGSETSTYSVSVQKFRFKGMPSSVGSGNMVINFSNHESLPITHEMVLISLPSGKKAQDVIDAAKSGGTKSEDTWLHFGEIPEVDTGATKAQTFDLPAGTYALACWQTGNLGGGTGPPHAARGMVFQFSVT